MRSFVCGAQSCDSCCSIASLHAFVPDFISQCEAKWRPRVCMSGTLLEWNIS